MPDFTQYAVELRRKGMTKMLLWQEYHEQYQEQAYAYTQFCEHFTRWFKNQKRSMRQLHVAGDKLFIDYCVRLQVVNPDTGEVREAEVFVATLGASNYTYVEAFPSQGKSYWLEALMRSNTSVVYHSSWFPIIYAARSPKPIVMSRDLTTSIKN
jgi:transposase